MTGRAIAHTSGLGGLCDSATTVATTLIRYLTHIDGSGNAGE